MWRIAAPCDPRHLLRSAADWPALAALAHKLRPSLKLLGAAALLPHLAVLEEADVPDDARAAAGAGLAELLGALPGAVGSEGFALLQGNLE